MKYIISLAWIRNGAILLPKTSMLTSFPSSVSSLSIPTYSLVSTTFIFLILLLSIRTSSVPFFRKLWYNSQHILRIVFMYTLNSTQFLFYHTIAVFFMQHQNIALIFLRFSTNLRINFIFFCLIAPNSYIFLLIYSIYCPFVSFFYLFTLNLCYIIIT